MVVGIETERYGNGFAYDMKIYVLLKGSGVFKKKSLDSNLLIVDLILIVGLRLILILVMGPCFLIKPGSFIGKIASQHHLETMDGSLKDLHFSILHIHAFIVHVQF